MGRLTDVRTEWSEAMKNLDAIVEKTSSTPVTDRTRQTVKAIVEFLDQLFEEAE